MHLIWVWLLSHKWIPFASLAIGLLVRLSKDDVKPWPNIPARWRVWYVFALGVASAVLEKVVLPGATWESALYDSLAAAIAALIGHQTIIASLAGGKEIPIPGLMKKASLPRIIHDDEITAPPSKVGGKGPPSGPSVLSVIAIGVICALTQDACTAQQRESFLKDTFADKLRCGMQNLDLPSDELLKRCLVNGDDVDRFLALIGDAKVKMAERAAEAAQAEQERYKRQLAEQSAACRKDAGAP